MNEFTIHVVVIGLIILWIPLVGYGAYSVGYNLHAPEKPNISVIKPQTIIKVLYEDDKKVILYFAENGDGNTQIQKFIEINNKFAIQSSSLDHGYYTITLNKKAK